MTLRSYDIECLNNAKQFIDDDPARHHTIPEIATYAGLSATKLKKGFKELFGTGLFKYWQNKRLEKCKEMIEQSDKSLKQISKSFGYKYTNNFSVAFSKRFGMSPAALRKKLII